MPLPGEYTFRDTVKRVGPLWLATGIAEKLIYCVALHLDAIADATVAAVKYRFPMVYGPGSLSYLGRMRRIRRGRIEGGDTYAARLRGWLDSHRRRGSPPETLRQLWSYYIPDDPVVNGGFEIGDPPNDWPASGGATADGIADPPPYSNSDQALELTIPVADAQGVATQTALEIGEPYTFTCWVHGDGTNGQPALNLGGTTFAGTTATGWQKLVGEAIATTTDILPTVNGNAATEDVAVFDDLTVCKGPQSFPRFVVDEINYTGQRYRLHLDGEIAKDIYDWNPEPSNPTQWPRYWLFLWWPHDDVSNGDGVWGDPGAWGDGVWGCTLSVAACEDLKLIPTEWNAGHIQTFYIVLLSGDRELWGYPDGTWGDPADWADAPAILTVVQS